jgi:hypothetical protein
MERAMGLAKAHNVTPGMNSSTKLSFCDLPHSVIVHRASSLGVSLDKSTNEIAFSVKNLKMLKEIGLY